MGFRAMGYRSAARFLAPAALALSAVLVVVVVGGAGKHRAGSSGAPTPAAAPLHRHRFYHVRPGDTLLSVALRTHVPLSQLQQLNPGIDPITLRPGQRLRLVAVIPRAPARRSVPAGQAAKPRGWPAWWPGPPPRPAPRIAQVRPGDTLTKISERTRVPLARLEQLNPKIHPDKLQPGQRLKLR
jgi:LysM repeat protein